MWCSRSLNQPDRILLRVLSGDEHLLVVRVGSTSDLVPLTDAVRPETLVLADDSSILQMHWSRLGRNELVWKKNESEERRGKSARRLVVASRTPNQAGSRTKGAKLTQKVSKLFLRLDEAKTYRFLPVGGVKVMFGGETFDFGLLKVSEREDGLVKPTTGESGK